MDNKLPQAIAKVALVAQLGFLSGCLVTVSHFTGGKVSSDLGADCTFDCLYQLNEGETLNRVFTAEASPGNEFVRWNDSLGQNLSMCPMPTQLECNLVINNLHPLFEGQMLNVMAQFRVVNGYNANAVGFVDNMTTRQGTFKQIDSITWVESYPNVTPTNYFNAEARTETRLALYDRFADIRYFFDFSAGTIRRQSGMAPAAAWGSVSDLSGAPTGRLTASVQFGDSNGNYKGDYIQIAPETWVYRKKGRMNDKYTFAEISRDDATVSLRDDSRNVDVVLNVVDGIVYSNQLSGPLESVGVAQRSLPTSVGYTVLEVSYGNDPSDPQGFFIEQGSNRWSQVAADGTTALASYELQRRSASEVVLVNIEGTIRVNIDLSREVISLSTASTTIPFPLESFEILDAK